MSEYECKRCGVIFDVKKNLVQHLKKKKECISINSESSREELLNDIIEKEGVECEGCGKKYSNIYNMRRHSCKLLENVKEELEKRIKELEGMLKDDNTVKQLANNTTNNIKTIDNSTTNSITNNTTAEYNSSNK
jgi:predicted nucleic acid-binding Zn ribbon protein